MAVPEKFKISDLVGAIDGANRMVKAGNVLSAFAFLANYVDSVRGISNVGTDNEQTATGEETPQR
jgi:hypothetical protein